MNLTKAQLSTQLNRVRSLGWLPHFEEAVETYTEGIFDVADLIGIASRETNLDPKWLKKAGDGGHGYGLMQADVRSFPEWIKTEKWKDAREGILKGAEILMQKWAEVDVAGNAGKRLTVTSSKNNKRYSFTAPALSGSQAQAVAISAYNCGRWAMYAASKGEDVDKYSTGKDYSADVMSRAAAIRSLLTLSAPSRTTPAIDPKRASKDAVPLTEAAPETPNVNIENADKVNIEKQDLPPTGNQTVTKEKADPWTRIVAIVMTITGMGFNLASMIEKRIDAMSGKQLGVMAAVTGAVAISIWAWHRSGERANQRTIKLIDAAADPSKNNVDLLDTKPAQESTK